MNNGKINQANLQQLFHTRSSSSSAFVSLSLVGIGEMPTTASSDDGKMEHIQCLFLSDRSLSGPEDKVYALPVPLKYPELLPIIEASRLNRSMSKVRCLALNSKFVNRDDGLFDNLPWKEWGLSYELDAAGNIVDEKYRFGKRDAFDRFNGKDWPGRSFSIGNLAARVMYEMNLDDGGELPDEAKFGVSAIESLAMRILKVELKEARYLLAEAEENLAIARATNHSGKSTSTFEPMSQNILPLEEELVQRKVVVSELEDTLAKMDSKKSSSDTSLFMKNLLQSMIDMTYGESSVGDQSKRPPYRGAYGYAPYVDSRKEMFANSILPYSGPFDLLCELINDQLRADVVGLVLEDTWLLDGLIIGGACAIERKPLIEEKTVRIEEENIVYQTEVEDTKADLVSSKDTQIVECDSEEVIAMAAHLNYPISVEKEIWNDTKIRISTNQKQNKSLENIPVVVPLDEYELEKQSSSTPSSSVDEEPTNDKEESMFSGIKTTSSLFDRPSNDDNLFRKNIPVPSLGYFDSMNIREKAALLLSLESFKEKLPRPRIIREYEIRRRTSKNIRNPLDNLLLPLIDESVRRQYERREALRSGDLKKAELLQINRSRRQQAKELADAAKRDGNVALEELWNEEADFFTDIRADATQDEGSYSSFLDKDEWYERDRRAQAKKLDKKKFGNLFDGL